MRTIASLGIQNPLLRVFAWLLACSTLSVVWWMAGFVAAAALGSAYVLSVREALRDGRAP